MGISRKDEIGDFVVGTTVERIVRHAGVPVLVVKERARQHYSRLMVATDFSDCSAAALRTAFTMFPSAEITLLHAYHVRFETLRGREGPAGDMQAAIALSLDNFLERTELPADVRDRLEINVDYGDVCQAANDHVRSSGTELAVIGTHGRSGAVAALMGSVARALIACLDCDVLLVRQYGAPEGGA
jgi:nucleotide-binding universal stress UspA family protein